VYYNLRDLEDLGVLVKSSYRNLINSLLKVRDRVLGLEQQSHGSFESSGTSSTIESEGDSIAVLSLASS
jgi:hypothetical protein